MAIKKCNCTNDYQDKKYGYGHRVCNLTKSGSYRCTVCQQIISKIEVKKTKKE